MCETATRAGVTANAFAEDRENCLSRGMTDFIAKPIDRVELKGIVNRYSPQAITPTLGIDQVEQQPASDATADQQDPELLDQATLDRLAQDTSPDAVREILTIYLGEVAQRIPSMLAYRQHH